MITIDPEVAERKLNSELNILNDPRIQIKTIGRGQHGNGGSDKEHLNLSMPMKALIGSLAKANGHGGSKKVAEAFGMNHSVVNRYKNGTMMSYQGGAATPNPELKGLIEKNVDKVRELAIDRLIEAMGVITPDAVAKLGANSAADLGLKMASIHEKLGPRGVATGNVNAQIVIMAPRVKEEKEYLTLEVATVRD